MQLLTKVLRKQMPAIYSQEGKVDPWVVCKFFLPGTYWSWYVQEPSLKPIPTKSTFAHTADEARAKIRTYQGTMTVSSLQVMADIPSSSPSDQFQATLDAFKNRRAIIHVLAEIVEGNSFPEVGAHAVVPYKLIVTDEESRIYYYDNNRPKKTLEGNTTQSVELFGVFKNNGFSVPDAYYKNEKGWEYNRHM
ncbi:MAG: hypothetical protein KatS3mg087_0256 [Patescibacteria group bacterium]|nr:MAG: hypothetical protein KatS3mg087_0256 [Patescibacteria group bacterium]